MPDPAYVHAAFSSIAERYVTANHILSMGTDIMWRARVVQMVAEWKPQNLLDIATGTGDLALALKRAFPEMEVLAVWTMPGKRAPYLCIEPWQGLPPMADETGRFEDKPYHITLGAGECYTCGYRMEVI